MKIFKTKILSFFAALAIIFSQLAIVSPAMAASVVVNGTLSNAGDVLQTSPTSLSQINFSLSGMAAGTVIRAEQSTTGGAGTYSPISVLSQSGGNYIQNITGDGNYVSAGLGYGYFQLHLVNQAGGIVTVHMILHGDNNNIVVTGGGKAYAAGTGLALDTATNTFSVSSVPLSALSRNPYQMINVGLGFVSGTVSTSSVFPYQQIPGYTNGQINKIRVACGTADSSTVFTLSDVTTATTIGTVALTGSTTQTTTLTTPFSLIPGDIVNVAVTTAGTASNCGITAEGQASTF